jgi:putative transcriptional regulator
VWVRLSLTLCSLGATKAIMGRIPTALLLVWALCALQNVSALERPRAVLRPARARGVGLRASAETGEYSRLSLRGGGIPPPLIPLVITMGGASAMLTFNAELRGRVLKLVQDMQKKLPGPLQGGKKSSRSKVAIPKGYDVRNGTWAYEVNDISPGCLLVASPDTFRFAGPRQVLDQSVILLVRHGKSGSSGFIINRPTQFDVGDVTKKLAAFEQNPLYLGGDIGEGVYMIHGTPGLRNATEVSDGIYYGGSEHAMSLVQDGTAKPEDFRFFFKYAAWAPGQLEMEVEAGCWCPVRSSLDLVLKPRSYPGLHFAKAHKVFWHQVLQTLGGRFQNVSRDTIIKEETERMKMEEWVSILQDGGNTSVLNHEGIEMGAMAMATVTSQLTQADLEAVHDAVLAMTDKVKAKLPNGDDTGARERLETLSSEFFAEYTLAGPEAEIENAGKDPAETLMVNTVVNSKKGNALALSFLYMASARQLGVPLRALNCTARMKVPVDFVVRHDPAGGEGADSQVCGHVWD